MQEWIAPYGAVLAGWLALGGIIVVQFLVADVAGIRARHVPGMPVTTGHGDFLFRATRTLANTNESLPLFVLLSVAAILAGAAPDWTARCVWLWVLCRAAYTACYYADWRTPRSVVFGLGQLGLLGLLGLGVAALA